MEWISNVEFQVVWDIGWHGWAWRAVPSHCGCPNLTPVLGLLMWPLSKGLQWATWKAEWRQNWEQWTWVGRWCAKVIASPHLNPHPWVWATSKEQRIQRREVMTSQWRHLSHTPQPGAQGWRPRGWVMRRAGALDTTWPQSLSPLCSCSPKPTTPV